MALTQCQSEPSSSIQHSAEKKVQEKSQSDGKSRVKEPDDKSKDDFKLTQDNAVKFLRKYGREHRQDTVIIQTDFGDITIRLYENTPLHRASFLYLTEKDYFDDTWFYRVSKGHVIQAGNTDGYNTQKKRTAIGDFKIPAEMDNQNYHKRGAVASVRSYRDNPDKFSDPFEFYISLGRTYTPDELERLGKQHGVRFSEAQKQFYSQTPGSPHLDGEHTVFGEVIDGMAVVEKINKVEVDGGEWPMKNVPIQVELK